MGLDVREILREDVVALAREREPARERGDGGIEQADHRVVVGSKFDA